MSWKNIGNNSPCNGCTERTCHCHSECEKYIEWDNKRRSIKKRIYAERKVINSLHDINFKRYEDLRRDKQGKRPRKGII